MSGFFWKSKRAGASGQGADQAKSETNARPEAGDEARFADTAELDRVNYDDEDDEGDSANGDDEKTQLSIDQRRPSLPCQPVRGGPPSAAGALGDDEDDDEKTALSVPVRPATQERRGAAMASDSLYSRLVGEASRPRTSNDANRKRDEGEDDDKTRQIQWASQALGQGGGERTSPRGTAAAAPVQADDFQDWLDATPAREADTGRVTAPPRFDRDGEVAASTPTPETRDVQAADGVAPVDEALDEDIDELSPVPGDDLEEGEAELRARARDVELLILDVDGVLTDGGLHYGPQGEALKRFHVQDGHGIVLARKAGLKIAILTARTSQIVEYRARELGIAPVFQGRKDKLAGFEALLAEERLGADQVAYMGDDLNDLGVLARVRLSACPADACPEVRERAAIVVSSAGGGGAVRELIEFILKAQGKWSAIVQEALADGPRSG